MSEGDLSIKTENSGIDLLSQDFSSTHFLTHAIGRPWNIFEWGTLYYVMELDRNDWLDFVKYGFLRQGRMFHKQNNHLP